MISRSRDCSTYSTRVGRSVAVVGAGALCGCTALAGLDGDYRVGETSPSPAGAGGSSVTSTSSASSGGSAVGTGGAPSGAGGGGSAPLGPFGAPELIVELADPSSDDDPTLTADMLEMYFDSARTGGLGSGDIWLTVRPSVNDAWSAPVNVLELNSTASDTTPEVSADGLVMFLGSARAGNTDLYVSSRATRSLPWSPPAPVVQLNSSDGDYAVSLSPNMLSLFMGSTRPGMGGYDLYTSSRGSVAAAWSSPMPVLELDTAADETDPWADTSRTILYFTTDRPAGAGGWDIWMTTRPTATATFGSPAPVAELNSAATDSDVWLAPDMQTAFFASNRGGNTELYVATR